MKKTKGGNLHEVPGQPSLTCRKDVLCSFLCTLEAKRLSSEAM